MLVAQTREEVERGVAVTWSRSEGSEGWFMSFGSNVAWISRELYCNVWLKGLVLSTMIDYGVCTPIPANPTPWP